jgi:hypothetical protein
MSRQAIRRLRDVHGESNARLQEREMAARTIASRDRWAQIRDVNNQAYFMLMFAQFEAMVREAARALVNSRSNGARGLNRNAWRMIDVARISFMDKVALLTDRGGSDYASVRLLYHRRNDIAHGNFAAVGPITITADYAEFLRLISALKL